MSLNDVKGIEFADSKGNKLLIKSVCDSYGQIHEITGELNRGGQGVVCKTENSNIVVKLALTQEGMPIDRVKNDKEFLKLDNSYKSVILRNIPDDVHLTMPMARLCDYAGYVMRFIEDMKPIQSLLSIQDFPKTGGHRRRFLLLSKLAVQLACVHEAGLVYCDLSGQNAFVTSDSEQKNQNVWLIDVDNIFTPMEDPCHLVYTPDFAAPELFKGNPNSQSADDYSLAVLAFECLAVNHPFKGDKATNWTAAVDDEDCWDKEEFEGGVKSMDGGLTYKNVPWIEDPEDDSNHTQNGFPRQFFLTDETFFLFNQMFTEGRDNPSKRPTAALFARAFAHSADLCVCCHDCGMSYIYDDSSKKCPWCQAVDVDKDNAILIISRNDERIFVHELNLKKNDVEFFIAERVFAPFDVKTNNRSVLSIQVGKGLGPCIEIKKEYTHPSKIFLSINGREEQIYSVYKLILNLDESYSLRYVDESKEIDCIFDLSVVCGEA